MQTMDSALAAIQQLKPGHQVLRFLGQGMGGKVFQVKDPVSGGMTVLKVFHEPWPFDMAEGLRLYRDRVKEYRYGLEPLTLYEAGTQIFALEYPYTPVYPLHWRLVAANESLAQAMFGAYCQAQAHVMSVYGLGLADTIAEHFFLDETGEFHFIDYGIHIERVDADYVREQGIFGYAFAMMLVSLYGENLKDDVTPAPGYRNDLPCAYCQADLLDQVSAPRPWVRELLKRVRSEPAELFYRPEFYQELAARFYRPVAHPRLQILLSKGLFALGKIKQKVARRA